MLNLQPLFGGQKISCRPAKPMRVFQVRINDMELRVLAKTSIDALQQVIEPFFIDGEVPTEGLSLFVKPEKK